MGKILLDFVVQLQNDDLPYPLNHNGPLFHKWLPDGENDAVVLDTGEPTAELKVSFKRFGFIDDSGYVRYDRNRSEIDPTVIPRQAVLEGGYMIAWLSIEMKDDQVAAFRLSESGDPLLEGFGKRIVKIIYPPIAKFINILRTNYGQYWLRELAKWDSRSQSLGSYCAGLGMRWSLDEGKHWFKFVPNERIASSNMTIVLASDESYKRELLTRDDWFELPSHINSDYEPSLAALIISRAYELCQQGHLRQAFIEGVTALEVTLYEYVRRRRSTNSVVAGCVDQFQALSLPVKVATLAALSGNVSSDDVEATITAYKIRNEIVHEGDDPSDDDNDKLLALLSTAATFVGGPKFRFPRFHVQNALSPPDKSTAEQPL